MATEGVEMSYDYTTPTVVDKIVEGQRLDITEDQAHEAIKQLASALKLTRENLAGAEARFQRALSDMETRLAKMAGQNPGRPKYQDGIRYETPPERPLGPDGFPQRGII